MAANPGAPLNWLAVVCLVTIVGAVLLAAAALDARSDHAAGRVPRRCPICGEDAVQATESRAIDSFRVMVGVQCGQCGVWRRVVATEADMSAVVRRVQRDRRCISSCALRMTRARARGEIRAFIAVLRSEIAGADDFLAATRPLKRPPTFGRR
jgi:hypothetical protein